MKAVPAAFAFVLAGGSAMGACTDVRSLVCTLPMSVSYDPVGMSNPRPIHILRRR